MNRRSFNTTAVATYAAGLLPAFVWAQAPYPSKPVKFIVPYAAGGQPDVVARMLTVRLGERLGQPVVVDNRPGAAGASAYNGLLQSTPADGHAFILSDGALLSISPHVNKAPTTGWGGTCCRSPWSAARRCIWSPTLRLESTRCRNSWRQCARSPGNTPMDPLASAAIITSRWRR